MNIRDLKYLVAVSELRNFSAAAAQCFVSQPTLSSQIKKLEESLGVQLFERTNKKVIPTPVGQKLVASAMRILREVRQMNEIAASAVDPLSGSFRLGAFPTLATYIFPGLVAPIKAAMPGLKLILVEDKTAALIEQLSRGDIDAALLALPVQNELFCSRELFEDDFVLAVQPGHELSGHTEIDPSVLLDLKLLLLEEGHCMRDHALQVCDLAGAKEDDDFRATGLETLRLMVKAGTGITLMPEIAVREHEDDICYIPFKEPRPKRSIAFVWRKTFARTAVIEELVGIFNRLGK